ncbi:MAG: enoyl-CoA hydratase/isomerase family protein [Spirochaetes bacterium]|nr:enoyl-CoA hydratase/isomerase family protein [Spirochaetota bacterium]
MSDAVLKEQKDRVAILSINKPKMNQLSHEVFETMRKHLDVIETDKNTMAVIITGAGEKAFSAGADLSSGFGDFNAVDFLKRGQDVWNKVEYFSKPVIAAINGHALGGGCELAMACHYRFMKKGARIGLTETNLGIMPGYGGSLRLPRLVGKSKALEMMWFGMQCEADEALAIGLVDRISEDGKLIDDALEFANRIAKRPPLSIAAITKLVNISPSITPDLHLKIEREELGRLFTTKDMQEGMTAFFSKREPVFKGE